MSETGLPGYLSPASSPAPLEDTELTDFLQQMVAGITGLDGSLVRQRWAPQPVNNPPRETSWAAVGIADRHPENFAFEGVEPGGGDEGQSTMKRNEVLDLVVSFYGPNAESLHSLLRDGLSIAQNREVLTLAGMGLVGMSDPLRVPAIVKGEWLNRIDLTVTIRRQIVRVYPVPNLKYAVGTIYTDE